MLASAAERRRSRRQVAHAGDGAQGGPGRAGEVPRRRLPGRGGGRRSRRHHPGACCATASPGRIRSRWRPTRRGPRSRSAPTPTALDKASRAGRADRRASGNFPRVVAVGGGMMIEARRVALRRASAFRARPGGDATTACAAPASRRSPTTSSSSRWIRTAANSSRRSPSPRPSGLPIASRAALAAADGAQLYDVPRFGNVSLLHMTDCHAQLLPIHFREPNVNLGIAARPRQGAAPRGRAPPQGLRRQRRAARRRTPSPSSTSRRPRRPTGRSAASPTSPRW